MSLYPQLVHKDLWIMWITSLKQQPLPLEEGDREAVERVVGGTRQTNIKMLLRHRVLAASE